MKASPASLIVCLSALFLLAQPAICGAQSSTPAGSAQSETSTLKFVVIISRHGVRSPTGKIETLNQYSAQPWPSWNVQPGYLTEHGFQLMKYFGAYDRALFSSQGLLPAEGCSGRPHPHLR